MKITRRSFFGASMLVALSVLALATVGMPSAAFAQSGSNEVPIKIQGYWGGTTAADHAVLGTIKLVDEQGKNTRSFGVTLSQCYDADTIGMDVFQQASMNPAIIVFGRAKEVTALFAAPDKQPLTILGVYYRDTGELIAGSVKPAAPGAAAPAKKK
jgi:hypothetical protein